MMEDEINERVSVDVLISGENLPDAQIKYEIRFNR